MREKHLFRLFLTVVLLVGVACNAEPEDAASPTRATVADINPTTTAAAPATTEGPTTTVAATTTSEPRSEFPVTVAGVVIPEPPVAVISLSPTATEILFAVGAGDQVIAVGSASDYPPEAPVTDLEAFQPNLEAIASYGPDLVVISWDPGEVQAGLETLGVPVLVHPPALSLDDAYLQMRQLGAATGNSPRAERLVASIQAEIAELVAGHAVPERALSYYHEVDDTLYSATSATFIGNVYSLFGLENIADAADAEGFGYPQLSGEYILEADPDLIFFGCALWCGTTTDTISERPGWSGLTAVRNAALVEVDDDLSSRWGPRIIEFVRLIGESLAAVAGADRQ